MTPSTPSSYPKNIQLIQQAMNDRQYETAIELTNVFMLAALELGNEDQLAYCLEIYDALCDKTKMTIEFSLKHIGALLDNNEFWVRQEALAILKKIFRVVEISKFDSIIEKCEAKLFDSDKKVRESAVNLIAEVLKKSYIHYPDLYMTYSQMFEDDSWRVRAKALEGMLEFLIPAITPPENLLRAIQSNFFKLIRDPDEEIRGLTTEAIKTLSFHLPGPEVVDLILPILSDTDWEIREKGIWIIGEIGSRFFDDFTLIFHKLVTMFSDDIMMIQTKTIDAFVKIGKTHGKELLEFFRSIMEKNVLSMDVIQGISESTIFYTLQNIREYLPSLIHELNNTFQKFRDFVGDCLIKIYMEKSDAFEEELARMYQNLDPEDWRQRQRIIKLLGDLSYVLHIKSVAVWTTINLQNWQKEEKDLDVLDEIEISLLKIRNIFDDIDQEIQEIEKQRKGFYVNIENFQNYVQTMRIEAERLVDHNQFQKAELYMEKESKNITEKLYDSEQILNNSEFRRFSVEIVQDFKEIKDEVMDNISDVKYIILSRISDGRDVYLVELQGEVDGIISKINQMKLQFDHIQEIESLISPNTLQINPEVTETLLEEIAQVRKQLYTLEFDIGQLWTRNLEFKEALKEVTLFWVDVKIEVQQYLATAVYRFENIGNRIEIQGEDQTRLKKKITVDFLSSNLQKIVLQAVQNIQDMLEAFSKITEPIYTEIKKKRFTEARNLVEMTLNNIQNSVAEYDSEIDQVYYKIKDLDVKQSEQNEFKNLITQWEDVKEHLKHELDVFREDVDSEISGAEIQEYLSYMNPLSLYQLNLVYKMEAEELTTLIFNLIKNHKLKAEIRNNSLVQPSRPLGESFLQLQRKVDIIGSKIIFDLRVRNPTTFFMNDMSLIFIYPPFLKLIPEKSDPVEVIVRDFEPESVRAFRWVFKIEKSREKRYELNKWLLSINYKNPFGKLATIQKEMEIIL
ncbi:MAG: hypothetical protein ACTSVZ_09330 [Promethearchaeota archaeon]